MALGRIDASARRERAAAAAIAAAGGIVVWDDAADSGIAPSSLSRSVRRMVEWLGVGAYLRTVVAVTYPVLGDEDWRTGLDLLPGARARLPVGLRALRTLHLRDGASDAELAAFPPCTAWRS